MNAIKRLMKIKMKKHIQKIVVWTVVIGAVLNIIAFTMAFLHYMTPGFKSAAYASLMHTVFWGLIVFDFVFMLNIAIMLVLQIDVIKGISEESVWANVFNNTISNSSWLKDKTFSPGRWAIGYQGLYPMYRILDEIHPENILELGCGQSTHMISQYASAFTNVEHIVVEHDPDWISFFTEKHVLPEQTTLLQMDCEMREYKNHTSVRQYVHFAEKFQDKKFDFIVIDAPPGCPKYSRVDILKILPDCLKGQFVIFIDDTNRQGEQYTENEIKKILHKAGIPFAEGIYSSNKSSTVITSENLSFLTSM